MCAAPPGHVYCTQLYTCVLRGPVYCSRRSFAVFVVLGGVGAALLQHASAAQHIPNQLSSSSAAEARRGIRHGRGLRVGRVLPRQQHTLVPRDRVRDAPRLQILLPKRHPLVHLAGGKTLRVGKPGRRTVCVRKCVYIQRYRPCGHCSDWGVARAGYTCKARGGGAARKNKYGRRWPWCRGN